MKKLGILMAMFFALAVSAPGLWAANADVYVEGAYTENDLAVYIYVDINGPNILSSGVKLTYETSKLVVTSAEKNKSVWFLGSETYMDPDTTTPGVVVLICGKLDEAAPLAGVSGDRVLLGKIRFNRTESSMPFSPTLSIGYAHGTGLLTDKFKNFVTTNGDSLDGAGIAFDLITTKDIKERGDANADDAVDSRDIRALRRQIGSADLPCWCDCNDDEIVDSRDIRCLRNKI